MTNYRIRPLDAAADTTDFCCGKRALDEYIRRYASQNVRRDVARILCRFEMEMIGCIGGLYRDETVVGTL